jgi:hypothetical protein
MDNSSSINCTINALAAIAVFLSADLVIATVHWMMDRYGDPSCWMRVLATIFKNNRGHHVRPLDLLRHGALSNAAETLPIAVGILLAAWLVGMLTWHVILFASAVAFSAVYHRILHLPRQRVCLVFRVLQRVGVLQEKRLHMRHHTSHDSAYSVLTNAVSRFLDWSQLFQRLERLIDRVLGRKPFDLRELSDQARRDEARK